MHTSRLVRRARRAAGTTPEGAPASAATSGAVGWRLLIGSLRRRRKLLAEGFASMWAAWASDGTQAAA
jgi:hypothetical protein